MMKKEANLLLYDSNYMTLWKRHNYEDSEKMDGFQELVGVGCTCGAQKICKAMKMLSSTQRLDSGDYDSSMQAHQ